jgi:hypothetical protein
MYQCTRDLVYQCTRDLVTELAVLYHITVELTHKKTKKKSSQGIYEGLDWLAQNLPQKAA